MVIEMAVQTNKIKIIDWGLLDYETALSRQSKLVGKRLGGQAGDCLILVEHPPVVTIGKSGSYEDLLLSEDQIRAKKVGLYFVDRGGNATCHGPGQMVAYPIMKLEQKDLQLYVRTLLDTIAAVLRSYGLEPELKKGDPGIWVRCKKIASIGIAVNQWVTCHGVALNIDNDLSLFNCIIPCGHEGEIMTSMKKEIGAPIDKLEVKRNFIREFSKRFRNEDTDIGRHPDWLHLPFPQTALTEKTAQILSDMRLSTVCESAICPNIGECFGRGTAAFLILGNRCTRRCRFCAIDKAIPEPLDMEEPGRLALAVQKLNLAYVVITSVTRDDLPDGGAGQFARTIGEIRSLCPGTRIEILVPDFKGDPDLIQMVCDARPDMFNHNIETVPRLYETVRPQASFQRSLKVLSLASESNLPVKSGMMLGLGETSSEVESTLVELMKNGCRYLTLGQYLAPSPDHIPVARYVQPHEFEEWARKAEGMGFKDVAAGPFVRSSYRADQMAAEKIAAA
jgi:lipoic acid synthetase